MELLIAAVVAAAIFAVIMMVVIYRAVSVAFDWLIYTFGNERAAKGSREAMALEKESSMKRLTIIPCSAKKARSGFQDEGSRLTDDLEPDTTRQLLDARERLRERAQVDVSTLLPAWTRYTGLLYESARASLSSAIDRGEHILIISGGYGVVKAAEPIGWYEAVLNLAEWPHGLLERCILEYARHHQLKGSGLFCRLEDPVCTALATHPMAT